MRSTTLPILCALLYVAAPLRADDVSSHASVLVNAAGSGNLNEHQTRYLAALPALTACAQANSLAVSDQALGAYSMWTVTEASGAPSTAALQLAGVLAPADDGGTVWGDEAPVFDSAMTACAADALAGVEGGGAGEIYLTIEFARGPAG